MPSTSRPFIVTSPKLQNQSSNMSSPGLSVTHANKLTRRKRTHLRKKKQNSVYCLGAGRSAGSRYKWNRAATQNAGDSLWKGIQDAPMSSAPHEQLQSFIITIGESLIILDNSFIHSVLLQIVTTLLILFVSHNTTPEPPCEVMNITK